MAKKKNISISTVVDFYMDYVVEFHNRPVSIEEFAHIHKFDEAIFYSRFDSFKDIEQYIFNLFFENSLELLLQSEEFGSFNKKDKVLSLYYTFFENLTLNRDFIQIVLKQYDNQLKSLAVFNKLKVSFSSFVETLELETLGLNIDGLEGIQRKTIKESAWVQLLLTIKFWLDDTSNGFEKTDIFIEKSLNTSLELLDTKTLNNVIDLAKFLYKEKILKG